MALLIGILYVLCLFICVGVIIGSFVFILLIIEHIVNKIKMKKFLEIWDELNKVKI